MDGEIPPFPERQEDVLPDNDVEMYPTQKEEREVYKFPITDTEIFGRKKRGKLFIIRKQLSIDKQVFNNFLTSKENEMNSNLNNLLIKGWCLEGNLIFNRKSKHYSSINFETNEF